MFDFDTVIPETQTPQSENERFFLEDFKNPIWESGIGYQFLPSVIDVRKKPF